MAKIKKKSPDKLTTELMEASGSGNIEEVKELLSKGADVNRREYLWENLPLCEAVSNNHIEVVRILLKAGADANKANGYMLPWTPLFYAIDNNNMDIVKVLLEAGADANKESEYGTPLSYAESTDNEEIVKILEDAIHKNTKEKKVTGEIKKTVTKKDTEKAQTRNVICEPVRVARHTAKAQSNSTKRRTSVRTKED